jgi:uncharacterized membrane protein YhdT
MITLPRSVEHPPRHLLGIGLAKYSAYCCLAFLPYVIGAMSQVDRGFDPCPCIASTSRAGIVDLCYIIVEFVYFTVKL